MWDTGLGDNIHLGWGPVGIFMTDDQSGWDGNGNPIYAGTPSTVGGITNGILNMMQFEYCGNAAILDISTGSGKRTTGNLPLDAAWSHLGFACSVSI